MHTRLLFLFLLFAAHLLPAQTERWRNQVLDDRIGIVTFMRQNDPQVMPFANIDSPDGELALNFDLMGDELRSYIYTLEHCNADWSRSDLTEDEYMMGFREPRIQDAFPSVNTLADYTVYSLKLPNSDMRWTKSGNYRLLIYDNTDDEAVLVLVQRFLVLEPQEWQVASQIVRPFETWKDNTHHEIDFEVDTKQFRIVSPHTDLKAYVLQNGRWDSAIGPLKPYVTRGTRHIFDYQNAVVFPAGKGFRFFDMRTFEFRKRFVKRIIRQDTHYEVALMADRDQSNGSLLNDPGFRGGFLISNETPNGEFIESDYAKVLFRLEKPQQIEDADVYIVGGFNDYKLLPAYKMEYNDPEHTYFAELMLKQGYYNYQYAVVKHGENKPDPEQSVEGNWYEAQNQYSFLFYYRSLSDRYDRLMGMGGVTSGK